MGIEDQRDDDDDLPPTQKSPETLKPALTFEEFTAPSPFNPSMPRYNNFFLYFVDWDPEALMPSPQEKPHFQKFLQQNPALAQELITAIAAAYKPLQNLGTMNLEKPEVKAMAIAAGEHFNQIRKSLEPQLYQAYLIMHELVDDDEKLFR